MYGKLFERMYTGSMMGCGAMMFAVWPYVIAHMKPNRDRSIFTVELNTQLMALLIGESEEDIAKIIAQFCEPDLKSRTPDKEGRKLVKLGTYLYEVVNGSVYDEIRREAELRESNRRRQERYYYKNVADTAALPISPVNPPAVPEKPQKPGKTPPVDCITIFCELNDLTGSKFRPEGASLAMLVQRLAQPDVSCEGVLKMVHRQVKLWKDDLKMREFLRPTTLFNNTKFNEYYAAREQPIPHAGNSGAGHAKPPIVPVKGSQPVGGF
jgi:uncharacterized phage protein (TIGR02220 family)